MKKLNKKDQIMEATDILTHVSGSLDYLEDHCPETSMSSLLYLIHSEVEKALKVLDLKTA